MYVGKEYFDKDYFETPGYKSGYDKSNLRRDSYLNKAIAVWIVQTLKLKGDERILEIGCAFGWVVEQMVKFFRLDAYGQDISHYSTSNAPPEIKSRIRECESVEIAFDGKFDLVYSLETFEHVPKPLIDEYFQNIYACLNDNGILFCTICLGHNDDRGADIDRSHQTLQPREWWNAKLEEAGFIIRKDLEAEAYELGLQTPEMSKGEWLPREYNWHVFVAQKRTSSTEFDFPKWSIKDRRLRKPCANAPKLLIIGSRHGAFSYPVDDFFQIDNWGNYLAHLFQGEYKFVGDGCWREIDFSKYDLIICSLDEITVEAINNAKAIKKLIVFLDGTPSMMVEQRAEKRESWLEALRKADIILSPGTNGKEIMKLLGFECRDCSHIFPLRWFDSIFPKQNEEQREFVILCGGYFESHSALSSTSAFLASKHADRVLMAIRAEEEANVANITLPGNVELFIVTTQENYYRDFLSQANLFLKMDNLSWCGRGIAEAAAAKIPAISSRDFFQIRCFPELMVANYDFLRQIEDKIRLVKSDTDFRFEIGNLARKRLIISNAHEYSKMIGILQSLGFDFHDDVDEQYW